MTRQTVGRWRRRFVAKRVAGLLDEPRPGAPRKITDEHVEQVVRLTLESTPRAATHWSTRAMARRCGLSQTAVSRIWRAFALQPHRVETFKLSKDPLFRRCGEGLQVRAGHRRRGELHDVRLVDSAVGRIE